MFKYVQARTAAVEVRKVQTTAAGTFLVTIPKEWAAKMGIAKGGHVHLELEDEDLVVAAVDKRPSSQSRPLDIDKVRDRKMLELAISASYIQGHDVTEIVSKDKILPEQKRWIRETMDNLVGVEVSEEYLDRVVLQNLVDPRVFDLDDTMKKFSDLSLAVLGDALVGLRKRDKVLAQDAYERGRQSTRLYRLLLRISLQLLKSRKLRDEMKAYDVDGLVVRAMAVKDLGRSAYYAYRVAQHVTEVENRLMPGTVSEVEEMGKTTAWMQRKAFESLMKKDIELASLVIDEMDAVRKAYGKLFSPERNLKPGIFLPFSLIVRDIRGIAANAVALADDAVLAAFK
jgi:phosphate uptake regulator